MPFTPKTSPMIRATLTAMDAGNALRNTGLDAAQGDAERVRVQTEHLLLKPSNERLLATR